ncbi:MAG: AEC family transporter [Alkalispirochaetaceae bacterium]
MSPFLLIMPLFIVMALGYVLKKLGVLDQPLVGYLNKLLTTVLLPALLFRSTSRTEISEVGSASLGFLAAVILVAAVAIVVSLGVPRSARGAFIQSSFRGNLAYLGLPVVGAVFGEGAISVAAAILAAGLILHVILTILLLQILDPDRPDLDLRANLKTIVTNPLILSAVAGLLFSATGLSLPTLLADPLDLLGRSALPLALLVIGCTVSFRGIRARLSLTLLAVAFKLVLMPALAFVIMSFLFPAESEILQIVVIMAASPTAILAQTFAEAFNADGHLTAATVALSTILGILAFPLWSALLGIA